MTRGGMVIVTRPSVFARAVAEAAFNQLCDVLLGNVARCRGTSPYWQGQARGYRLSVRTLRRLGARRALTDASRHLHALATRYERGEDDALAAMEAAGFRDDQSAVARYLDRARRRSGIAQAVRHAADAWDRTITQALGDAGVADPGDRA